MRTQPSQAETATTARRGFNPSELIGRRVWLVDFHDTLVQRGVLPARFGYITGVIERGRVHVTYFLEPGIEGREENLVRAATNVLLLENRQQGCDLRTTTRTAQAFCYPHIDPIDPEAFFKVKG